MHANRVPHTILGMAFDREQNVPLEVRSFSNFQVGANRDYPCNISDPIAWRASHRKVFFFFLQRFHINIE